MMTDEQIKQNAEEYILPLKTLPGADENITFIAAIRVAFETGAHSRDEEIKELNARIVKLMCERDSIKSESEYIINKLRNPWISVEDGLPKKTKELEIQKDEFDKAVLIRNIHDCYCLAYLDAEEIWRRFYTYSPIYQKITHWMPIPKLS